MIGLDSPLIHSPSSHTACPMNADSGLTKANPCAEARPASVLSIRSAVWFSSDSSLGLNHVAALQSSPLNSRGYPTTTTLAVVARDRIALYSESSLPGSVLRMMLCALDTAAEQLPSQDGSAHVVITEENPASLPPTWTVTHLVPLLSPPSWPLCTDEVVAPLHAENVSVAPIRAASVTA